MIMMISNHVPVVPPAKTDPARPAAAVFGMSVPRIGGAAATSESTGSDTGDGADELMGIEIVPAGVATGADVESGVLTFCKFPAPVGVATGELVL